VCAVALLLTGAWPPRGVERNGPPVDFLDLKGARAWPGVRGRAAADRLTSARSSGLGVIEFSRNWGRAGRLEGKEEAHRNNGNAHSRE